MGVYDCDCINNLEYDRRERRQKEQSRSTAQSTAQSTNLIDRRAAIDALQKCRKHCIDPFDSYHIDIQDAENQLSKVPTIQSVATDTNVGDKISRQQAIELIKNYCENGCDIAEDNWCPSCQREQFMKLLKALPTVQPEPKAQLSKEGTTKDTTSDLISRQAAIRWVKTECNPYGKPTLDFESGKKVIEHLEQMPPAQPEPSIPLSWIEKYIEWLKRFDNEFANLDAAHISVMVKKWRDEQDESD